MSIPTIYSNVKQALPGEEITVIASIGSGEWEFPNALSGDIEIVEGSLTSNVLIFKCLNVYDPLIVSFKVIEDKVFNGSSWTDAVNSGVYGDDVLADGWTTPSGQENMILTGWNFEGRSQRVNQTLSGVPSITQANLTVSGESYTVELDYRAYTDIELKVGGHTFELSATNEGPEFPIYPIQHGTGVVSFETTNGGNVKWLLADGSVVTNLTFTKELLAGTSYLIMDSFVGQGVNAMETGSNYIGSLSDFPSGLGIIQLDETNVYGDIAELNHVEDVVNIVGSDGIYGDVKELSGVSYAVDLSGCPNIYGDISYLDAVEIINLDGTSVSGSILETADVMDVRLNNTNLNKDDLELTLVNLANRALSGGYFECIDNMPTVNSTEACAALFTLTDSLSWTVLVNSECGY